MNRFTLPRDIYFGNNSLEVLKTLKGKRATIVIGGSSMKRYGFLQMVESYLGEAGIETQLIEGVEPDPSVETVMEGAGKMQAFEPDWIVSIGGGSPIDAAKAMWIFYEYPEAKFDEISKPFNIPPLRRKARFVAIPSTSGTASEVTAFSVITDYSTKIKYPLAGFEITPDVAILDPAVAETMPPYLVACTGMDALTHATEAYVAALRSDFSDPLALKAIRMVKENLVASYKGDKEAKAQMHIAQCLAGMAFSNALLGIVHSMAHKSGAVFGIPHGCANAIYLPYVIEFNRQQCGTQYAEIARFLGLQGETEDDLNAAFVWMVKEMNRAIGLPLTLKEFGVGWDVFSENLEIISKKSTQDPCTMSNPRIATEDDFRRLFTACYRGDKVDF